jgi:hypothetical protein
MAVNALGLPLLFQTGPGQLSDLFSGLQPGDTLRGRVIELVGLDQAVVSIKGQNLVAQLPANSGLQKGDALLLQVGAFNPADLAKGASLTLRLLPGLDPNAALGAAPDQSPALAGPGAPGRLEQILNAAQLPPSAINLKVAETLTQLGAPTSRADIQGAAQATIALLGSEQGNQAPQAGRSWLSSPAIQAALRDGLSQLQVASQFNPSSQNVLILQQAVRAVGQALEPASGPAPTQPSAAASAAPPADVQAGAAARPLPNLTQAQAQLAQSLAALAGDPHAQNLQGLQSLLGRLSVVQDAGSTAAALVLSAAALAKDGLAAINGQDSGPAQSRALAQAQAGTDAAAALAAAASEPSPPLGAATGGGAPGQAYTGDAALPSLREALVQFLAGLPSEGAITVADARAALQALSTSLADPGSATSQRLLAAVQAQQPGTEAQSVLASARQALQQAGEAVAQDPAVFAFNGAGALQSSLQLAGLPVPQARLSALGSDQVAEAVAWLQARDLPPQRPLVEAVATWISQDRNALPAVGRALEQASQLPQALLDAKPGLQSAVDAVQTAWQQAGLSPDHPELALALRQWSQSQGLNLESGLLAGAGTGKAGAAPVLAQGGPVDGSAGLRPALQRLEGALRSALHEAPAQDPAGSARLVAALKETQAAVQALNAVPLQAQSPPAFDSVHLPLPVWLNGQIAGGQLSVTWRKGRERALDDKEAVNVAVALNTESLGTVKVLLQVWKGSASARVLGETPEATAFLAKGAADLREGFAERTPFLLQNLEFAVADAKTRPDKGGLDAPARGGLNVSA